MNDPKAISILEEIVNAARDENLTFIDRCALHGAAEAQFSRLRSHLDENLPHDGYASEKFINARWHMAAMLGFEIDNGHGPDMHRVWALGDLSNLLSRFSG